MKACVVNKAFLALLVIASLVMMPMVASAADASSTTKASISFMPGNLEWDDNLPVGMNGMNFNFGTNLELPAGHSIYTSTAVGNHTLRIKDARKTQHPWSMTVAMGNFQDVGLTNSFEGAITMTTPTSSHTALVVENPIVITSTSANVLANNTPTRDVFDATWAPANVKLAISAIEAETVVDTAYEATLTWTLSTSP